MSVSKACIAEINNVEEKMVCCRHCAHRDELGLFPWCKAWDLSLLNLNLDEDFCSFWAKRLINGTDSK